MKIELSPGKSSIIGCTPSEFTLLQPATAQHYYANAANTLIAQTGQTTNTTNLLSVSNTNNGSSSLLTTAVAALVDENGTMTSSLTPTSSLDYQGKIFILGIL